MILFFAIIALVIFIFTAKRLALVSSIAFFIAQFISTRSVETFSYEAAVISMMILNFSVFSIAVAEYRKHHTDLTIYHVALSWIPCYYRLLCLFQLLSRKAIFWLECL